MLATATRQPAGGVAPDAHMIATPVPVTVPPSPRKPPRRRRYLLAVPGLIVLALTALWISMHRLPWLGPRLADAGRRAFGDEVVARLEDWAYGAEDTWNRFARRGERPQPAWQTPPSSAPARTPAAPTSAPSFPPADVGPVHEKFAAAGDGVWVPVRDERRPLDAPLLYKTMLHPDERRAWSELFVVAIDRAHVRLRLVAGTVDPEATTPEGKAYHRVGLIPVEAQDLLIAAFNGGFKTEHGHLGMRVDGVTLVPPRGGGCTVSALDDESIRIAPWADLAADEPRMLWWRQTPACLVDRGEPHPELASDGSRRWGAAVGGETVIRRSAIGLSADQNVLYVGISEATTAGTLARGMRHAGGWIVAQLDVNWSYPKFLVFRGGAAGEVDPVGLFPGFDFEPGEYVRKPAPKDFFYVLRR
jgi:hypothetical protein